jgi:hypothetical protein
VVQLTKKRWNAALQAASNEMITPTSDEEPPPEPKSAKSKLRDAIDTARKKIEDRIRKEGGDMAKPTFSQEAEEGQCATPLLETPPQVQASGRTWGRALKRTVTVADLKRT